MAYREVSVFEIKEVLRLWLRGEGYRAIDRLSGVDRKTAAAMWRPPSRPGSPATAARRS